MGCVGDVGLAGKGEEVRLCASMTGDVVRSSVWEEDSDEASKDVVLLRVEDGFLADTRRGNWAYGWRNERSELNERASAGPALVGTAGSRASLTAVP